MKIKSFLSIILVSFQLGNAQDLDLSLIKFRGLDFYSSREQIEAKLGAPDRVYEPNYDCGGLSAYWQDQPFYSLVYEDSKFTGNDTLGYLIEEIHFSKENEHEFRYRDYLLDHKTGREKCMRIFKREFFEKIIGVGVEEVLIISPGNEEGLKVGFRDGKLIKITYWTSC
ncbi:MAG: hypothetical protein AAFR66_14455 [Bacteroidota bacterium]